MKQKLLIIFLSISSFACKTNQLNEAQQMVKYYPIAKEGIWGFANENGDIVIPYQFEEVSFFVGERASVKSNGKYGFINKQGDYLLKPKYDTIGYFTSSKANVIKHGKALTINNKGKKLDEGILISRYGNGIEYASNPKDIFEINNGKFVLNQQDFENQQRLDPLANFTLNDFTFDEVLPFSAKSVIVKKNNKYDIFVHFNSVGLKGIQADKIIPNFAEKSDIENQIKATEAIFRIGEKWGLISNMGYTILEPEFHNIISTNSIYYLVEYMPDHWGTMTLKQRFFKH